MQFKIVTILAAPLFFVAMSLNAGVVNPDCTAKKAVKSTAMKATVGVSGRCDPAEAVKDTIGIDEKGPLDKHKNDKDGVLNKDDKDKDKKKKNK